MEINSAKKIVVVLGAHNIMKDEPNQVTLTSTEFTTHQEWNPYTLSNDIAVVKLPHAVKFNSEYLRFLIN